jgi:molybdenum cofactor guanylyltransferase
MTAMDHPLPDAAAVSGVVLAGGRGCRVGGADKGLLELDGRPLAAHVADNLRAHCATIIVSANRHLEQYAAVGDLVVGDRRPGFQGPLAGLEAALAAAATPWLLVTPCDMPAVPTGLYRDLLTACGTRTEAQLVVADDGTRVQPLVCAVRRSVLAGLSRYLDEGGRAVFGWLDATPHVRVIHAVAGGLRNQNEL